MQIPEFFCAYVELTRTVDRRRERVQFIYLPPVTLAQARYHAGGGSAEFVDRFVIWQRRQDHAAHRSRWQLHDRPGRAYAKNAAHGSVGFYLTGPSSTWKPSPIIKSKIPLHALVADLTSGKTPYKAYNRLKGAAERAHGLDIS